MSDTDFDFEIKRNDTGPSIEATLKGADGNPINGNTATVRFHMTEVDADTPKIDAPARWVSQLGGIAAYDWSAADTDTASIFDCEFEVEWGDGTIITFPNEGFKRVRINRDLA